MNEKKNKIGILTFHCSNNYGAVLQAYALRHTLQKIYLEKNVHVIDYKCKSTVTKTSFSDLRKAKGIKGAILHYRQINSMNQKFNAFRSKYLNLSDTYWNKFELENSMDEYAAIISGSDQVWNMTWSGDDAVYFQDFHKENKNKFSYAASFGFEKLSSEQIPFYKQHLEKFKKISVREDSGKTIIEEQLGLKAEKHIDPTMLLTKNEWSQIAEEPRKKGKYILVYMVPKQESVIQYSQELSKRTGLPIVMLSKNIKPLRAVHAGGSSPEEFLGWFKNAEFIVTNSFHGTAFALIYEKKLFVELNNVRGFNVRSKSLLDTCEININIPKKGELIEITDIDWNLVNTNIHKERNKAIQYLSSITS